LGRAVLLLWATCSPKRGQFEMGVLRGINDLLLV